MKLPFGFELRKRQLNAVYPRNGGWYNILNSPVLESYQGAWQQNVLYPESQPSLLTSSPVFACVSGISSDIAKMRLKMMRKEGPIWVEVESGKGSNFLPVLSTPNHYQTDLQFLQQWVQSILLSGNAYIALERNNRGGEGMGDISAMHVLDPCSVRPLVSDSGMVFYQVSADPMADVFDTIVIPAEDIIHDRINCHWHKLIGVAPLTACAASGYLGARIQADAAQFYSNRAMPGGMISAPKFISNETAARLKETFESEFSGTNIGKVFIAGDGLTFQPFRMTAEASQTAEQLKMTVSDVARAFRYPEWKLGGQIPSYANNYQAYQLSYAADALQFYMEGIERSLDKAFAYSRSELHVEFDDDNLLRMDTASLYDTVNKGERFLTVDEQRLRVGYDKTPGGDQVYRQEQDHSLPALAARDKSDDPFGTKAKSTPNPQPADPNAARDQVVEFDAYVVAKRVAGEAFERFMRR